MRYDSLGWYMAVSRNLESCFGGSNMGEFLPLGLCEVFWSPKMVVFWNILSLHNVFLGFFDGDVIILGLLAAPDCWKPPDKVQNEREPHFV